MQSEIVARRSTMQSEIVARRQLMQREKGKMSDNAKRKSSKAQCKEKK